MANAQELAGMKVRHTADELNEGETMILTLADREILDERGEIDDDAEELENSLVVGSCDLRCLDEISKLTMKCHDAVQHSMVRISCRCVLGLT